MGLLSDILPIRSPIFEVGIVMATVLLWFVTIPDSEGWVKFIAFLLGAALSGSSIIIAAIECDMGNYVISKYNKKALGTFSGIIDGFASIGSVLSQ